MNVFHLIWHFSSRRRRKADSFNIYRRKSWNPFRDSNGRRFETWSAAEAGISIDGAVRVALGLLRDNRRIRRRFPDALSAGECGPYADWLATEGAPALGLTNGATRNFRSAFHDAASHRVLQFYLHSPPLQKRFPRALLTAGQKSFVRWLLHGGKKKYGFTNEEIAWFLHQAAEELPKMVLWTWLISPEWQDKFPLKHPNAIQPFLHWLWTEFSGCPGFARFEKVSVTLREFQDSLPRSSDRKTVRGVNILSHFCYPSGIQRAALLAARALETVGLNVLARDVPTSPRFDIEARECFLGLEAFPVTIISVAPQPFFQNAYEWSGLSRKPDIYRIAYWAWELDDIPAEWAEGSSLIDEIWAPTKFVADAFRRRMPNPVHVVLPAVEVGPVTPVHKSDLGIAAENYVFLFMFDMCSQMSRKNPLAVIRAFHSAFPNPCDVTLVIKVSRGEWHFVGLHELQAAANIPNVLLINDVFLHSRALGLIQMCDCFVSLHRSEGFGLCLAEAMLLGKPVIATNYSGNLAFMHADNSLLVDYTLIEIVDGNNVYRNGNHWAEPSIEQAASYMRWCYEHRAEAIALGARAQAEMADKLSMEMGGRRMIGRINEAVRQSDSFSVSR